MSAYVAFIRENSPWLFAGALLSFLSSFGQTFFISIFAGEIREGFGLSHGQWGGIYTFGTGVSALAMVFAGGLADRFRVRVLGIVVVVGLATACFAMALNPVSALLPVVIFALRFFGQGMASHVAMVAMARWFVATRGKALAFATFGFASAEAGMPLTFVALKRMFDWHQLWIGAGLFCLAMIPVLLLLLRRERTPAADRDMASVPGMGGRHWTRADALRHPLFWSLVPALLVFPAFVTAFWFQQVHFAEIKGWSHLSLVAVFPLGTATFIGSTALFGWAIDRFGAARLLPVYLLPLILAFFLHAGAQTIVASAVGVVLMGLAGGGQATLPSACWAEFYGTHHLGSIKSAIAAVMVFGSALGPGLSGWLIEIGVELQAQYAGFALCFGLASLVMLPALRAARTNLAGTP